jgi:hypothetical protein
MVWAESIGFSLLERVRILKMHLKSLLIGPPLKSNIFNVSFVSGVGMSAHPTPRLALGKERMACSAF